jgi:hypothetical protein
MGERLFEIAQIGAQGALDGEETGFQTWISRALGKEATRRFDRLGRARKVRCQPPAVRHDGQGFPPEVVLQGSPILRLGKQVYDRPGGSNHLLPEEGVQAGSGPRIVQDRLEHREALEGGGRADLPDLRLRADVPDLGPPAPSLQTLDIVAHLLLEVRHETITGLRWTQPPVRSLLQQASGRNRGAAATMHHVPDGERPLRLAGRPVEQSLQRFPTEVSAHPVLHRILLSV